MSLKRRVRVREPQVRELGFQPTILGPGVNHHFIQSVLQYHECHPSQHVGIQPPFHGSHVCFPTRPVDVCWCWLCIVHQNNGLVGRCGPCQDLIQPSGTHSGSREPNLSLRISCSWAPSLSPRSRSLCSCTERYFGLCLSQSRRLSQACLCSDSLVKLTARAMRAVRLSFFSSMHLAEERIERTCHKRA